MFEFPKVELVLFNKLPAFFNICNVQLGNPVGAVHIDADVKICGF
jgi:hypothetical protein